jgi:hypothetical protein
MTQRKALIASIMITLILAFSAIGLRATMLDSPDPGTSAEKGTSAITLSTQSGANTYDDDHDDQYGGDNERADDHEDNDEDSDHQDSSDEARYTAEHDDEGGDHDD